MSLLVPVEGSLSVVWLAYIQAFVDASILMIRFAYFLWQNHDREEYEYHESSQYALFFGFTIAMVDQTLFVWSTGRALPGIAILGMVLASLPRLGSTWLTAWVLLERRRLLEMTGSGPVPPAVRTTSPAPLALPPGLHTLY